MITMVKTPLRNRIKAAQMAVAKAKALWLTIDEIDRASHAEALAEFEYPEEESGERITNPDLSFLMSTENGDFERYCRRAYEINVSKDLDSGDYNTNFWSFRRAQLDAEAALIDLMVDALPGTITASTLARAKVYPHREKALDIMMRLDTKTMPAYL